MFKLNIHSYLTKIKKINTCCVTIWNFKTLRFVFFSFNADDDLGSDDVVRNRFYFVMEMHQ